jgi:preprotein translocase subunit SecB
MQDYSNEERGAPHIAVNAQYIKDFSFENPGAPGSLSTMDKSPQIDLSLDLNIQKLPEEDYYEVEISISAKALSNQKTLFVVDLKYAGVFNLINIIDIIKHVQKQAKPADLIFLSLLLD